MKQVWQSSRQAMTGWAARNCLEHANAADMDEMLQEVQRVSQISSIMPQVPVAAVDACLARPVQDARSPTYHPAS
jgi:hypothetical protein